MYETFLLYILYREEHSIRLYSLAKREILYVYKHHHCAYFSLSALSHLLATYTLMKYERIFYSFNRLFYLYRKEKKTGIRYTYITMSLSLSLIMYFFN